MNSIAALALWTLAQLHHGPLADDDQVPSHVIQWEAHTKPRPEIAFHFGLTQPIFLQGFNAAIDIRYDRFIFSYSHGQGLHYGKTPGVLSDAEKNAGLELDLPITTGFGVGLLLVDELHFLVDFKLHHFDVRLGEQTASYSTVTIGAELGYRFFIWKGLHVAPVLRYWPNVWTNAPANGIALTAKDGSTVVHHAAHQGFGGSGVFVNVLVGWAFDL